MADLIYFILVKEQLANVVLTELFEWEPHFSMMGTEGRG
jgi:hypothetical protein